MALDYELIDHDPENCPGCLYERIQALRATRYLYLSYTDYPFEFPTSKTKSKGSNG